MVGSGSGSGGGSGGGGRLLARLVAAVHQAIERLLTGKGTPCQGQAPTRVMLAREAFALLALLSGADPAGLGESLSCAGARWALEAVNFRLVNQLVQGLEDLVEEAQSLHEAIGGGTTA